MTRKRTKAFREKEAWRKKFRILAARHHKRKINHVADRILKRASSTRYSLVARSKKYKAECKITTTELLQLLYDHYGKPCKYCNKTLVISTLAIDHIVPLSKGGSSSISNLAIICKTSNHLKGSLSEEHFLRLLAWLDTQPEELARDIKIRLARGIC
jgi:5-methylcytosine-specific restriction endonuclease McrA